MKKRKYPRNEESFFERTEGKREGLKDGRRDILKKHASGINYSGDPRDAATKMEGRIQDRRDQ